MEQENNKKSLKNTIIILVILIILLLGLGTYKMISQDKHSQPSPEPKPVSKLPKDKTFTINFIREVNQSNIENKNYLVSPYSVEVALELLKAGAKENTKDEIDKVSPSRDLKLNNKNVKIANASFIKNTYKNYIEKDFISKVQNEYNSDIIYDEFKTPNKINEWVSNHTDKMIPKLLEKMNEKFVLGLANAIAIDAKWQTSFECSDTTSKTFTKETADKINVEMMSNTYKSNIKYLDEEDKGIILSYKEDLEFIAILPKDGIDNYVNNLDSDKLENIDKDFKEAEDKNRVNLELPRFSYEYDLKEFKKILKNMGIKDVFDKEKANLSGIITKENIKSLGIENIYVDEAIHKTNINLNEKGTKAAAITYFGIFETSSIEDMSKIKIHNINFDKPFIYMIRDKETKNILFFGTVYEPNKWNGTTCEEK